MWSSGEGDSRLVSMYLHGLRRSFRRLGGFEGKDVGLGMWPKPQSLIDPKTSTRNVQKSWNVGYLFLDLERGLNIR